MPYIIIDNPEYEESHGWGGKERIEFDIENPEEFHVTYQHWEFENPIRREWIRYNVVSEIRESSSTTMELLITYNRGDGQHLFDNNGFEEDWINWGTHTLSIDRNSECGPSVWQTVGQEEEDGPGWKRVTKRPDGGRRDRPRSKIWAIQRGTQGQFRQQLLEMDGCCAISGEVCREALEAAHVVPAHGGGTEELSNGILLRADLHRLYDANLPKFEICPDTGEVRVDGDFNYDGFDLNGTYIDEAVRRRVKDALHLRRQREG